MNRLAVTWVILIVLTIIVGFSTIVGGEYIILSILIIAVLKFILVSFNFMDIIKAHSFWKIAIISYLSIFTIIILLFIY